MGALALLWVAVGFTADQFPPQVPVASLEILLWCVFALDFTTRIVAAHDRRQWMPDRRNEGRRGPT